MLTKLLRYDVADVSGRRVRVADFRVSLLEDDYPPVTHVLFHHDGRLRQEEWDKVTDVDWRGRRINIEDLDAPSVNEDPGEHDERDILLVRDIVDALVLDLAGRTTTRVADLRLKEKDGAFRLIEADAGLGAMIRRVTRGVIGRADKASLFDWKYIEFLRGDPEAVDNGAGYRHRINRLPAGEIARLADYVPYLHAAELLKLLPDEKAADVLQSMSLERQVQVIDELDEDEAVDLIRRMSPDLATDLLGRLNIDTMRAYINKLPEDRRDKVVTLLRYPENSVGGVMINELVVVPASISAGEAQALVQQRMASVDFVSVVFMVNDEPDGKLKGSMSLRSILSAPADRKLEELMDPYLGTLDPFDNAVEAAHKIVSGQLEAMPVTDTHGRLVGAMTIATAISQLVPTTSGLRGVRVFS